jgi:hypothetical protein
LSQSVGTIRGFRSWRNIRNDYQGYFQVLSLGVGVSNPGFLAGGVSTGVNEFFGLPNFTVNGASWYLAIALGIDLNPTPIDISPGISGLWYTPINYAEKTYNLPKQRGLLISDILNGDNSPLITDYLFTLGGKFPPSGILGTIFSPQAYVGRLSHVALANWYADIYEDMHGLNKKFSK